MIEIFKKILCFIITINILAIPFSVFADNYTTYSIFSKPGALRNYFEGTQYEAITNGDVNDEYVVPSNGSATPPSIYFDEPVKMVASFLLRPSTFNNNAVGFYLNGVLQGYNFGSINTSENNINANNRYFILNEPVFIDEIRFRTTSSVYRIYEFDIIIETVYPQLVYFMPSNGSTGVSVYDNVTAVFDRQVKTLTPVLKDDENNIVPVTVTGLNTTTVRINPSGLLNYNKTYTLTLDNVTSLDNYIAPSTYTMSFTTMSDTEPIKLINVIPPHNSTNINPDITSCILEFNKPNINLDTVNSNNVYLTDSNDNIIPSTINHFIDDSKFIIDLAIPLLNYETDYYINVKDIIDTNNNPLETTYKIRFKTADDPNVFKILSYRPVNNSVVSLNRKIEIVFSHPLQLDGLSYVFKEKGGENVSSVPQIIGSALYITSTLEYGKEYVFELETIQNTEGQILNNPITINFRTMNSTNNNFLNSLLGLMMDLFENVKHYGMIIVICAVILGVIFVVAWWLWKKLKKWLIKS